MGCFEGAHRRAPDSVTITPRRIVIDYGTIQTPPEDWYAGDAAVTEVFHALSVTFPAGESFFMDSVRHFEETLRNTHPLLWQDVVLFFKQESLHSAQHEKWNRRIEAEFGHPMMKLERCIDDVMQFQKRFLSPLNQLACTAAFEHFTATFGQILLESTDGLRQMGAPQRRLWMWHALEEIEHKAVAFDVYQAVSGGGVGGYLRRCLAMMWVTVFFALTLGFVRIYLHWRRGILFNPQTAMSMFYFGMCSPGYGWRFVWPYVLFFHPGFHPWQQDDSHLLAHYSAVLESEGAIRT